MARFIGEQLRHRGMRAAFLGGGMLVAAVSFVLLASAAKTSEISVRGSVQSNYRAAYDILVRPKGSSTPLEQSEKLVRDNALSGIFGGITFRQWHAIERIPGVEVAAPVANLGYMLQLGFVHPSLRRYLSDAPFQLYRVRFTWLGMSGTSRYPAGVSYIYVTRRDPLEDVNNIGLVELLPNGRQVPVYLPFIRSRPLSSDPFDPGQNMQLDVFSTATPGQGSDNPADCPSACAPLAGTVAGFDFPIFVAAVDPVQEARLLHLDRTVVSGRYLRPGDRPAGVPVPRGGGDRIRVIPALASTRPYLDDVLEVSAERLQIPANRDVPMALSSRNAFRFVSALPGVQIARWTVSPRPVYREMLAHVSAGTYWRVSGVRYRTLGPDRISPRPTRNPISVWRDRAEIENGGYFPAPADNQDVQFRRLHEVISSNILGPGGIWNTPWFRVVGRFDPTRLPSFSPLSRVPLETYYPPVLLPADAKSQRILGGKPLLPTQNVGGYIAQPPLLLTTLQGIKPFLNPRFFAPEQGSAAREEDPYLRPNPHPTLQQRAPISIIRVRVKGVTGPDALSQERIRTVATLIHDRTGLDVDITAGSSPHPLLVRLPRGRFGTPSLLLREGWSKKGVSVSFLRELDRKDLALFLLIPAVCAFFLANGALAGVRARRSEIGTLLCLGWSARAIFAAVLGELLLVGAVAGALGTLLALVIALVFSLTLSLWSVALCLPVALALALVSGLVPAWRAARSVPLDAVRPAVTGGESHLPVRRLWGLALVNLGRVPGRTSVAVLALAVGVAAFSLLIAIERAFSGSLVGTLLGNAISVQVRGVDFLAVGLTVALAGLSLADVLLLNLRERAPELVTLRTCGWRERHLAQVVLYEALALGLCGVLTGAALALACGALLTVPWLWLVLGTLAASAGGLLVACLASLVPIASLPRLTPAVVLSEA